MDKKTAVVAFSGGLDTTFCVIYLKEQGFEVVTVTANTGNLTDTELAEIEAKATSLGSASHYTRHVRKEIFDRFGSYIIKGNILRGGVYPLCVGVERIIQAECLVDTAHKHGAQVVCHGCSGAGNDQIRFDTAIRALDRTLTISAPIRDLELSREMTHAYLRERGVQVTGSRKKYSINQGILGTTIGGGETHDSWMSIPNSAFERTCSPEEAPDTAEEVIIGFEKGLPVSLNGFSAESYRVLEQLDEIGGKHGVGRGYHIGDTVIGIKGRLAFEAPGACILIAAHRELEKLVLTKWQSQIKEYIASQYGMLFHEGLWANPVMRDIESFIDSSQRTVSGEVRVLLYKGSTSVVGCRSPFSLMTEEATYGEKTKLWTAGDVAGFSKLFGLQTVLASAVRRQKE